MLGKCFNLMIGDFGFATNIRNEEGEILLTGKYGTPQYMAPEVSYGAPYSGTAADVFSCGVILFLLVTVSFPFSIAIKITDPLYRKIVQKDYKSFWESVEKSSKKKFSGEFKDLINSMLAFDPRERATIQKIKDHPWFKGHILDAEDLQKTISNLKEKVDAIRVEYRLREKEEAAKAKALAKESQEEELKAPLAFAGVHPKM